MYGNRNEIYDFANEMEEVMKGHDNEKGDSWKTCSIGFLEKKLKEEFEEWSKQDGDMAKQRETVDIANICMMLFHRYGKG